MKDFPTRGRPSTAVSGRPLWLCEVQPGRVPVIRSRPGFCAHGAVAEAEGRLRSWVKACAGMARRPKTLEVHEVPAPAPRWGGLACVLRRLRRQASTKVATRAAGAWPTTAITDPAATPGETRGARVCSKTSVLDAPLAVQSGPDAAGKATWRARDGVLEPPAVRKAAADAAYSSTPSDAPGAVSDARRPPEPSAPTALSPAPQRDCLAIFADARRRPGCSAGDIRESASEHTRHPRAAGMRSCLDRADSQRIRRGDSGWVRKGRRSRSFTGPSRRLSEPSTASSWSTGRCAARYAGRAFAGARGAAAAPRAVGCVYPRDAGDAPLASLRSAGRAEN